MDFLKKEEKAKTRREVKRDFRIKKVENIEQEIKKINRDNRGERC